MVIAESYSTNKRARTLNSNNASGSGGNDSSDPMDSSDQVMRVGSDYQAEIPDSCLPKPAPQDYPEKSEMVWTPNNEIDEKELRDYLKVASEKYKYNDEQSLALLFFHKFKLTCALADLANFSPYPDEWSSEDKVLFELGYQNHNKNFKKINLYFPEKKLSSVIKYYYNWKKTKTRGCSYVERQMRKSQLKEEATDSSNNDNMVDSDSESETNFATLSDPQPVKPNVSECRICGNLINRYGYVTRNGNRCHNCFKNKGKTNGPSNNNQKNERCEKMTEAVNYRLKIQMKTEMLEQVMKERELNVNVVESLDAEIREMKKNLQEMKQQITDKKIRIKEFVLPTVNQSYNNRIVSRWTNEETLMMIQAISDHGKDFKTIAEIMGTKTEQQISNYYLQNCDKMGFSKLVNCGDDSNKADDDSDSPKTAKLK